MMRGGAVISKRAWRSSTRRKPRSRTAWRRCASTAPTATRRSSTSSATTGTRRCSRSAKAPTSCSALSSRASWSSDILRERRSSQSMLPLSGVRVLAVEQYGAGPFGTMFLADQGAEVIKIENPNDGGDMSRAVGPHFFSPGDSEFFHSLNRNKKSLTLDLGRPEGQAVLRDLVRTADALASNLRGDVQAKLGLVYENLKAVNPKIVCAHLSAY